MEIKIVVHSTEEKGTCIYKLHRTKSRLWWKHHQCRGGLSIQESQELAESLGLKCIFYGHEKVADMIPCEPEHLE